MTQSTDYFTSQWYFADLIWRLESVPVAYHISRLAKDLFAGACICSKFPSNKPTIINRHMQQQRTKHTTVQHKVRSHRLEIEEKGKLLFQSKNMHINLFLQCYVSL